MPIILVLDSVTSYYHNNFSQLFLFFACIVGYSRYQVPLEYTVYLEASQLNLVSKLVLGIQKF